jgi:hypothetical protein
MCPNFNSVRSIKSQFVSSKAPNAFQETGMIAGPDAPRGDPAVIGAALQLGLTPFNLIVWAKTNAGMGSLYRSQHELLAAIQEG